MGQDLFLTTLWSRISDARQGDESAVVSFVDRYRPAALRFVRGRGFSRDDAEDLVQEVFLRLFAKEALSRADRDRGRFRSFLVGICMNVIREELHRRGAKKRGGGKKPVPLADAPEPAVEERDEADWDQIWAEELLQRAFEELRQEHPRQYETLALRFQEGLSNPDIAERMGRTAKDVRNDLHRARKRVIKMVRAEILRYSSSKDEFEDDMALFARVVGLE